MCFGSGNDIPPPPPSPRAPGPYPVSPPVAGPYQSPPVAGPYPLEAWSPANSILPKPPSSEEMMDVIDEITGTETRKVTGSDGRKYTMIKKLPKTKEEAALYDEAGRLMERAVGEIQKLYDYDPKQLVHYAPFVNTIAALNQERSADMQELTKFPDFNAYVQDFKDIQRQLVDEEYNRQSNSLEENLARRGLVDSTTGREERNLLNRNATLARSQVGVEAQAAGERAKAADLANRTNMFNLRESTRLARLQDASTEYGLQKDYAEQQERQRDKAIGHQANLFNIAAGIRGEQDNKNMATKAPYLRLADFEARNNNALNYYKTDSDRIRSNYDMQLAEHNSKPPSFGQMALGLGTSLGSAYLLGRKWR